MKYLFVIVFLLPLTGFAQNPEIRAIIKEALADKTGQQISVSKIIPDKQTAIAIAEPILFKIYGKEHILGEKPYRVYLVDDYWVLGGSLPENYVGGTFFIILSSKDGRVIKLYHGK